MNAAFRISIELHEEYGADARHAAHAMREEVQKQGATESKIRMWADICEILGIHERGGGAHESGSEISESHNLSMREM